MDNDIPDARVPVPHRAKQNPYPASIVAIRLIVHPRMNAENTYDRIAWRTITRLILSTLR